MAGAGWFGILNTGLGGENPYDEASKWSDEAQKRNRQAVGLDANGNPLPADPNNPVNNGQSAAMGTALATGVQPPGQQPNATKTDPSLGHILMDMTQYQQREQGFNQAMGAGFAAVSQPRDREWVSKIFNVNEPDAGKLIGQTQDLASQQQGQDRMNVVTAVANDPQKLQQIANALHMDPTLLQQLIRTDPNKAAGLIQSAATPTDALKNLGQLDYYGKQVASTPGATSADTDALKAGITAGIAGERMAPMIQAQIAWRQKHGTEPPPWGGNDIHAFEQWQANEASKETTRGKAAENVVAIQEKSEELRRNLEQVRDMPGLQSILDNPLKREAARKALADGGSDWGAILARTSLDDNEKAALGMLRKIGGANYSEALRSLAGTGTRVTQQEAAPLAASLSQIGEMNMDYKTFVRQAVNPLITRTKRIVASAYGSSGNFSGMDKEYEPWVHSLFRDKKGELYKEGSGADDFEPLKPVPDDLLKTFKAHVIDDPGDKDDVLDHLQQQGYDVSKYRKTDATKW